MKFAIKSTKSNLMNDEELESFLCFFVANTVSFAITLLYNNLYISLYTVKVII